MPTKLTTAVFDVFLGCNRAAARGQLIRRESRKDKEYHFQNWFGDRLSESRIGADAPDRNTYPDYRLVALPEGYEIKALAYPGREANYDANSQVPTGFHNGRMVFYLFGRYPKDPAGDEYPLIDFVLCHGDFLNADHEYVHKNKNIKGFGSYGDIMIRDRKMYVAPTPFALTNGTTGQRTLILPGGFGVKDSRVVQVGEMERIESKNMTVGYEFDLKTNKLTGHEVANPTAGKKHRFIAYRVKGASGPAVTGKSSEEAMRLLAEADDDDE